MQNRTTIQVEESLRKELKKLSAARDKSYQELLEDMIDIFKELDKTKTIISIPTKLAEKIKQQIKNTDLSSVSEYVTFLLRLVLSEKNIPSSKTDEKLIKQKLKNLGYLG